MKKNVSILFRTGLALLLPLALSCGKTNPVSADHLVAAIDQAVEAQVLKDLHQANQDEIALGNQAQKQAADQGVKDYGKMLVDDHTKADQAVLAAAQTANVTLPAVNPAPTDLNDLRDQAFDREFLSMMVEDHQDVLDQLNAVLPKLGDGATATLIKTLLPTIQSHLDKAKQIQQRLGYGGDEMAQQKQEMQKGQEQGQQQQQQQAPEQGKPQQQAAPEQGQQQQKPLPEQGQQQQKPLPEQGQQQQKPTPTPAPEQGQQQEQKPGSLPQQQEQSPNQGTQQG